MKGIQIINGFNVLSNNPIDKRYIAKDMATMDTYIKYEGLRVYNLEDNTVYIWRNIDGTCKWDSEYSVTDAIKHEISDDANLIVLNIENSDNAEINKLTKLLDLIDKHEANEPVVYFKNSTANDYYTVQSLVHTDNGIELASIYTVNSNYYTDINKIILNYNTSDNTIVWKHESVSIPNKANILELLSSVKMSDDKSNIEFYNRDNILLNSIDVSDLILMSGIKLKSDKSTGIISILDKDDNVITSTDTEEENIIKDVWFDTEAEALKIEFYSKTNEENTIVSIPLSYISKQIKYYTADEDYLTIESNIDEDDDNRNNTNVIKLTEKTINLLNKIEPTESNLAAEITRATEAEKALDNAKVNRSGDIITGDLTVNKLISDNISNNSENSTIGTFNNALFNNITIENNEGKIKSKLSDGTYREVNASDIAKDSDLTAAKNRIKTNENDIAALKQADSDSNADINDKYEHTITDVNISTTKTQNTVSINLDYYKNQNEDKENADNYKNSVLVVSADTSQFDSNDVINNNKLKLSDAFLDTLAKTADQNKIDSRLQDVESTVDFKNINDRYTITGGVGLATKLIKLLVNTDNTVYNVYDILYAISDNIRIYRPDGTLVSQLSENRTANDLLYLNKNAIVFNYNYLADTADVNNDLNNLQYCKTLKLYYLKSNDVYTRLVLEFDYITLYSDDIGVTDTDNISIIYRNIAERDDENIFTGINIFTNDVNINKLINIKEANIDFSKTNTSTSVSAYNSERLIVDSNNDLITSLLSNNTKYTEDNTTIDTNGIVSYIDSNGNNTIKNISKFNNSEYYKSMQFADSANITSELIETNSLSANKILFPGVNNGEINSDITFSKWSFDTIYHKFDYDPVYRFTPDGHLYINGNEVITTETKYVLPIASEDTLGGVKIANDDKLLSINKATGILSVDLSSHDEEVSKKYVTKNNKLIVTNDDLVNKYNYTDNNIVNTIISDVPSIRRDSRDNKYTNTVRDFIHTTVSRDESLTNVDYCVISIPLSNNILNINGDILLKVTGFNKGNNQPFDFLISWTNNAYSDQNNLPIINDLVITGNNNWQPNVYVKIDDDNVYLVIVDNNINLNSVMLNVDLMYNDNNNSRDFVINFENYNDIPNIGLSKYSNLIPNNVDIFKGMYRVLSKKITINGEFFNGTEDLELTLTTPEDLESYYSKLDIDNMDFATKEYTDSKYLKLSGGTVSGNINSNTITTKYVSTQTITSTNNGEYTARIDLADNNHATRFYSNSNGFNFYVNSTTSIDTAINAFSIDGLNAYANGSKILTESNITDILDNSIVVNDNKLMINNAITNKLNKSVSSIHSQYVNNDNSIGYQLYYYTNDNTTDKNVTFSLNFDPNQFTILNNGTNNSIGLAGALGNIDNILTNIDTRIDTSILDTNNRLDKIYNNKISNILVSNNSKELVLNLVSGSGNIDLDNTKTDPVLLASLGDYITYDVTNKILDTDIEAVIAKLRSVTGRIANSIKIDTNNELGSSNLVFSDIDGNEVFSFPIHMLGLKLEYNDTNLVLKDSVGNILSTANMELPSIIADVDFSMNDTISITFSNGQAINIPLDSFQDLIPYYIGDEEYVTYTEKTVDEKLTRVITLTDSVKNKLDTMITSSDLADLPYLSTDGGILNGSLGIKSNSGELLVFNGMQLTPSMIYTGTKFILGSDSSPESNIVFHTSGFNPSIDDHLSLGTDTNRFKNIYVSGSISDGINNVNVSKIVDKDTLDTYTTLDTDQTLTGYKTFNNGINIGSDSISSIKPAKIYLYNQNGYNGETDVLTGINFNNNIQLNNSLYSSGTIYVNNISGNEVSSTTDYKNKESDLYLNRYTNKNVYIGDGHGTELSYLNSVSTNQVLKGSDLNNFKYYLDETKQDKIESYITKAITDENTNKLTLIDNNGNNIECITPIATNVKAGIVKPGDKFNIDSDGTLNLSTEFVTNIPYTNARNIFTTNQMFTHIEAESVDVSRRFTINGTNIDKIYLKKAELASVYTPMGSVETYFDLPSSNNAVGNVYTVINPFKINAMINNVPAGEYKAWSTFVWTFERQWSCLGNTFILSDYITEDEAADNYLSKSAAEEQYFTNEAAETKLDKNEADTIYMSKKDAPVGMQYIYDEANQSLSFALINNLSSDGEFNTVNAMNIINGLTTINVNDASIGIIDYIAYDHYDTSFTSGEIEQLNLTIPNTVTHGWSSTMNILVTDTIPVLNVINESNYNIIYVEDNIKVSRVKFSKNTTERIYCECDGINVYIYGREI